MSANKLKNGYGDGVCIVLVALTQATLQNKFRFKKPVIKEDGQGFGDDDGEDNDDAFEGTADINDGMKVDHKGDDSEDIDCDLDFGGGAAKGGNDQEQIQQAILHSNVARDEWMLEVERVGHKLKINKTGGDGKEWRAHMDQTKKFHE